MKIFKILILLFPLFSLSVKPTLGQSDSAIAVQFFIDGKSEELKNNFPLALENYMTALKYNKSSGLYYAISRIYAFQGKFKESLIEINNALKITPDNIDYLEHKARVYYTMEDLKRSSEVYENIIAIDSDYTVALFNLARIYEELKQSSKALLIYERITEKVGFDMEILRRMFDIYSSFQDYNKCAEVMEYALKLEPYNSSYLQQLAGIYAKLGRDEDAHKIFEEMFALNPGNKTIQTELVKLYFKGNEIEKGFDNFAKIMGKDSLSFNEKVQLGELYYNLVSSDKTAITVTKNIFNYLKENYPGEWSPHFFLAQLDIANNDVSSATEKLNKAKTLADTSKEAYIQIGYAFFNIGKTEESKNILEKGITLSPDDFRMNYFYGLSLQRLGNVPAAVLYFEKAANLAPNEISVLGTLAMAYNTLKRFAESDEAYEKALQINALDALTLNNYAYNLSVRGVNLEKALAMAKIAVEKEPNSAFYLDTMGWVFYKIGNYVRAKELIEKAVAISPANSVLREHLGDIYDALKDYKNAKIHWEKALELNPNNQGVKEKLKFIK